MNPLVREKSDGTLAPGYLAYLLGALALVAGVAVLHRRADAPGPRAAWKPPSRVAGITQPASEMARVRLADAPPPPEARSFRLGPAEAASRVASPAKPADGAFDAIGAALRDAPVGESEPAPVGALDEVGAVRPPAAPPDYAELPPAFPPGAERTAETAAGPEGTPRLLAYRDPDADRGAYAGGSAGTAPRTALALVPRGTLLPVYLLTTVDTSNPSAILQFAAARALVWRGRRPVPFGAHFLGRLSGPPLRDRLNLAVDTVLYPDGGERPLAAMAIEADERGGNLRPGLAASYFPPPAWVQVAPYVSDAFTGVLALLELRAHQSLGLGVGGLTVTSPGASDSARAPVYQASAQALQDFTQARLKEAEQRYASYYLIPAGTACWLQLQSDFHE